MLLSKVSVQTYPDENGNIVCMTVVQYSSVLSNAARPFPHLKDYPCDLCGHFMRNIRPDIRAVFEELFDDHAELHNCNGRFQRTAYAKILKLATKAENEVKSTQNLVARQVGQSFVADALASQAERTLSHYSKNSPLATSSLPPCWVKAIVAMDVVKPTMLWLTALARTSLDSSSVSNMLVRSPTTRS